MSTEVSVCCRTSCCVCTGGIRNGESPQAPASHPGHVCYMHSGPCAKQCVLDAMLGTVQCLCSGTSGWLGWTRDCKAKCGNVTGRTQGERHRNQGIQGPHTSGDSRTALPRSRPFTRASDGEEEAAPWVQLLGTPQKQLSHRPELGQIAWAISSVTEAGKGDCR